MAHVTDGQVLEAAGWVKDGVSTKAKSALTIFLNRVSEREVGDTDLTFKVLIVGAWYLAFGPTMGAEPPSIETAASKLQKQQHDLFVRAFFGKAPDQRTKGAANKAWKYAVSRAERDGLVVRESTVEGDKMSHRVEAGPGKIFTGGGYGSYAGGNLVTTLLWLAGGIIAIEFIARATGEPREKFRP